MKFAVGSSWRVGLRVGGGVEKLGRRWDSNPGACIFLQPIKSIFCPKGESRISPLLCREYMNRVTVIPLEECNSETDISGKISDLEGPDLIRFLRLWQKSLISSSPVKKTALSSNGSKDDPLTVVSPPPRRANEREIEQITEKAVDLRRSLNFSDLTFLLRFLSSHNVKDMHSIQQLNRSVRSRVSEAKPHEISQLCWTYQSERWRTRSTLKKLCEHFLPRLQYASIRDMVSLVSVFPTLQLTLKDSQLQKKMHQTIPAQIILRSSEIQTLPSFAFVLNVFSKINPIPLPLFDLLANKIIFAIETQKTQIIIQNNTTNNAPSTTEISPQISREMSPQLSPQMSPQISPQMSAQVSPQMSPSPIRSVSLIANAYARAEKRNLGLMHSIGDVAELWGIYGGGQDISLILNSFAKLDVPSNRLFAVMVPIIFRKIHFFSPQALVLTFHAYAKMGFPQPILYRGLSKAAITKMAKFKTHELGLLAYSLARVSHRDVPLLTSIADEVIYRGTIAAHIHHFDLRTLEQLTHAFARLGLHDKKIFFVISELGKKNIGAASKIQANLSKVDAPAKSGKETQKIPAKCFFEISTNREKIVSGNTPELVQNPSKSSANSRGGLSQDIPPCGENECMTGFNKHSNIPPEKNTEGGKLEAPSSPIRKKRLRLKRQYKDAELLDAQTVSTILHGFGRAKMRMTRLHRLLLRKALDLAPTMSSVSLSNVLFGCTRLNLKDKGLFRVFLAKSKKDLSQFSPIQLTMLLTFMGKSEMYRGGLFSLCLKRISIHLLSYDLSALVSITHSCALSLHRDESVLEKITHILTLRLAELSTQEICLVLNSLARLRFPLSQGGEKIHTQIYQNIYLTHLHQLTLPNIALILHSIALLQFLPPPPLFSALLSRLQTVTHAHLSEVPNVSQAAKIRESNNLKDNCGKIEPKNRKNNEKNTGKADENDEKIAKNEGEYEKDDVKEVKIEETKDKKEGGGKSGEKSSESLIRVSGLRVLQTVDLYMQLEQSVYYAKILAEGHDVFVRKLRNISFFSEIEEEGSYRKSSAFHRDVSKYLELVGLYHRSEVRLGPYRVDVLLGKNVIIELDGPGHYYKGGFIRTAKSRLKDQILRRLNYTVTRVPYTHWQDCQTPRRKMLYCASLWGTVAPHLEAIEEQAEFEGGIPSEGEFEGDIEKQGKFEGDIQKEGKSEGDIEKEIYSMHNAPNQIGVYQVGDIMGQPPNKPDPIPKPSITQIARLWQISRNPLQTLPSRGGPKLQNSSS